MKFHRLKKSELVDYCKSIGIETKQKSKSSLLEEIKLRRRDRIIAAKNAGIDGDFLKKEIFSLANQYAQNLKGKINARKLEMVNDDKSHYLLYEVLGVPLDEGAKIDEYQNTGRFLYQYAGAFLEEVVSLALFFRNPHGGKARISNDQGQRPKHFEIDFLDGKDAIEIKWRDATTDGDHITKEHTRVKAIVSHGYRPVRVMFFYPQRKQAQKIQETLKTLYRGVSGAYYADQEAWQFMKDRTGYDLKEFLESIAEENRKGYVSK